MMKLASLWPLGLVIWSGAALGAQAAHTEQARTDAEIEAQLSAARANLEQAARQVAELSAQLGREASEHAMGFHTGFQRSLIGLQLDTASGKDGARVAEVSPGGPAAEAGVRAGDVIVAVNGAPINGDQTARQLVERLREIPPDTKVHLGVKRAGKMQELDVTTRPGYALNFATPFGSGNVRIPPGMIEPLPDIEYFRTLSDEVAGMELATLTPTLGEYFGTHQGVLVVRAPASGAFHLQDGDVILAIDGREPRNGSHATRILRSYQPGEKFALHIIRQRKPLTLDVTMPEPAAAGPHRVLRDEDGPVLLLPPAVAAPPAPPAAPAPTPHVAPNPHAPAAAPPARAAPEWISNTA